MGQKANVMAETENQSDVVPGTVFTPRQVRILKRVVIAMGVLLVGGFALIMVAIVYQASQLGESADPSPTVQAQRAILLPQGVLRIPEGMTISHMALDDNRLAVHLTGPRGGEIRVIDLGTGSVISTIRVKSE
jgi:hypothetical protein